MEGKLVKEYGDFYLISDKEIESGDEYVKLNNRPRTLLLGTTVASAKVPKLSLENCISIEKGYDIEELAKKSFHTQALFNDIACYETGFIRGFLASVEILGDKKFSEDDMKNAIEYGIQGALQAIPGVTSAQSILDTYIQSLQQDEWEVEIKMDDIWDGLDSTRIFPKEETSFPKLDTDGNLILKRK